MTYSITTKNASEVLPFLAQGRIVAFPTGTSYGLAVDALQGHALQRLRNLKQRPESKTFTVFMSDSNLSRYLDLTQQEKELITKMKNLPLTLLVKPKVSLSHLATDGYIGLRIIDHPLMEQLSKSVVVPLTATSANISNQDPCLSIECVLKSFPGRISSTTYDLSLAAVLDGGELKRSSPSTIAKIINQEIEIIREGSLTKQDIQQAL